MKKTVVAAVLAAAAGCFTVKETEYPKTEVAALPEGSELSVRMQGFAATFVDYVAVYGYDTVWVHGAPRGRYGWRPGHYSTVTSSTYVPQSRSSDYFLDRARTSMEAAGFITEDRQPDYLIDVRFEGPFISDSERLSEALWTLLSIFSADYSVHTWTAKIKIYDNKTGRMVFHRDYSQRYEVAVWGPLPLLSPAGSSKGTFNAMQNWCLSALTDRAVSDAAAFLLAKVETKSK